MANKSYEIEWRPHAEDDLNRIIDTIAMDSPIRARSFGAELEAKITALGQYPELGRSGRFDAIRELVLHPNYIVFYRVLIRKKVIRILHIRHAARFRP